MQGKIHTKICSLHELLHSRYNFALVYGLMVFSLLNNVEYLQNCATRFGMETLQLARYSEAFIHLFYPLYLGDRPSHN
jgi:hypothetical protein